MATFQRKTLRNLSPLAREIAIAINECDAITQRLKRLLVHLSETELDAQALRNKFPDLASDPKRAYKERLRKARNKLGLPLSELDEPFHSPVPLERQLLGEQESVTT